MLSRRASTSRSLGLARGGRLSSDGAHDCGRALRRGGWAGPDECACPMVCGRAGRAARRFWQSGGLRGDDEVVAAAQTVMYGAAERGPMRRGANRAGRSAESRGACVECSPGLPLDAPLLDLDDRRRHVLVC